MGRRLLALLTLCGVLSTGALADAQPSLKMMIPANPGGGWDQTGRNLAQALISAKQAVAVQFENRGGAGGTIGLAQFVNAFKGDPNALIVGGMVMVGAIYLENSPVNLNMVTPIARLTGEYEIIVVPANSPHKTTADLVKAFKANPGSISWGGGSAGGTDHILVGLIARAAGVDPAKINYVPFKGGGESIAAIVGGHVTAGVSGVGEYAEQVKGGRMRALAVSSPKRVEGFPTLKEQGIDIELANWRGVFGAPAISPAQTDTLVKMVRAATGSKHWKDTVEKLGWSPIFLAGDGYKKFIDEDTKRVSAIIDSLGIKK